MSSTGSAQHIRRDLRQLFYTTQKVLHIKEIKIGKYKLFALQISILDLYV